jgi:predicted nucleic acid-binding protein
VTYFLDASALVKRYIEEPGSDTVRSLARRRRALAASRLSTAMGYAAAVFLQRSTGGLRFAPARRERALRKAGVGLKPRSRISASHQDAHRIECRSLDI